MLANQLLDSGSMLLASGGAVPPLQFRPDLMLFSLLIFLAAMAILMKFAWKPIMEGLETREKSISGAIEEARLANEQAQASLKEYEGKLAGVNDEATAIIAEAKSDAQTAKDRMMADAKAEANREREKAMADISAAKDAAVRELAEKSVDSAVSLAGNIVGRSLQKNDHAELIAKAVDKFKAGA